MSQTEMGARQRAIECVIANTNGVEGPSSIEDICTWATGAVLRYLRGQPEPTQQPVKKPPAKPVGGFDRVQGLDRAASKASGFTGDPCGTCGNFTLRRTGTCTTCQTCGANTGCS